MNRVCWYCGKTAEIGGIKYTEVGEIFGNIKVESASHRAYCKECYEKHVANLEETRQTYIKAKAELLCERAIRILEKQNIDIEEYKEAILATQEFSREFPERFMSAHEFIAAVVLIKNEIATKTQHKIGKYKVDFYLPEYKMVFKERAL